MERGYSGWSGSTAHFYWRYSPSYIKKRKGFGKALNYRMAEIVHEYAYAYTPWKTGLMARAVRISASETDAQITYTTGYAKYQHDNLYQNYTTHGGPFWDRVTWQNHHTQIIAELNAYRKQISKRYQ